MTCQNEDCGLSRKFNLSCLFPGSFNCIIQDLLFCPILLEGAILRQDSGLTGARIREYMKKKNLDMWEKAVGFQAGRLWDIWFDEPQMGGIHGYLQGISPAYVKSLDNSHPDDHRLSIFWSSSMNIFNAKSFIWDRN